MGELDPVPPFNSKASKSAVNFAKKKSTGSEEPGISSPLNKAGSEEPTISVPIKKAGSEDPVVSSPVVKFGQT